MPLDQRKLRNHKARLPDALHPFLKLLIDRARNVQGSPHKPLLALMMLMRLKYEGTEKLSYREIKPVLEIMLRQLNVRTTNEALVANPFWRLQNEGIWKVTDAEGSSIDELAVTTLNGPKRRRPADNKLRKLNPVGSFSSSVLKCLNRDPELIDQLAEAIIDLFLDHHSPILVRQTIGFYATDDSQPLPFSRNVYKAYRSKCWICDRDKRLFNRLVDLNPTPIHPDAMQSSAPSGGIALCDLHNLLFRSGLITIVPEGDQQYSLRISTYKRSIYTSQLKGIPRFGQWLRKLEEGHRPRLNPPASADQRPSAEMLEWHREKIFL